MMHVAEKYAKAVLDRKIKTCELTRLAVKRHVHDLETAHKRGLVFDKAAAERWIQLAHLFRHWKNARFTGQKMQLEPWQQFMFWVQFGWKVKKTGVRRFTTIYTEMARKQGKTTMVAIKGNGHFWLDDEVGAQVWFAATKKDQALIGLNDAANLAKATPVINKHYEYTVLKEKTLRVYFPKKNSFMAAIGRDTKTEDGYDPSYGIVDEMHAHPDMSAVHILESGMVARAQPTIDIITTAGFNKQGPCYSIVRKTVIEILRGIKEDDSTMGMIYTLDDDDNWEDPANWYKSNPNLDVTVEMEALKNRHTKARNEGGDTEVDFKTKNLNIWTDAPKVWIPDHIWQRSKSAPVNHARKVWYAGLDLASVEDFCSYAMFSEPDADGYHDVMVYYFIPEEKLADRQRRDKNNYRTWIADGHIMVTPGNSTDYDYIFSFVTAKWKEYQHHAAGYDKWNASMLVNKLNAWGCDFLEVSQGITSLSEPTKELHRLALKGRLRHGGNPVLRWNCANVVIRKDANANIRLDKEESADKIDGLAALVSAIKVYQHTNQQKEFGVDYVEL